MKTYEGSFRQIDDTIGTASQSNNALLCRNIKKMIDLIMADKREKGITENTIKEACSDLGITYTSFKRWEKGRPFGLRAQTPLYAHYKAMFVPHLSKDTDLVTKDLTNEMRLIDIASASYKSFLGYYYVYYYSAHAANQIHFGRLRLFMEGEELRAKLVIGITNTKGLNDNGLLKAFDKDSNSSEEFNTYKKNLTRVEDRYRNYYYGTVSISPTMLTITLSGRDQNNEEDDHKFVIVVNIKRVIAGQSGTGDIRPYRGGMSMALSFPNKKHPSLRIFRMGISKWELPSYGVEASEHLLKHDLNDDTQRIMMSDDDDRAWFHSIAKYEPK